MSESHYQGWVERNAYTTTLLYSAFIGVFLPAFHYVLRIIPGTPYDSLPLRLVCTCYALAVAGLLLLFPQSRKYAEYLQFAQVLATLFIIDILVVDSGDQYLYIASALLVTIAVQNAMFRTNALALAMSAGFAFFVLCADLRGILWEPYNITTMAIFLTGYVLAFIPASMHIASRQSDIRSKMQAQQATRELEEAHAITHLGKWSQDVRTGKVQCSAELLRILDLPAETPHDAIVHLYLRSVHPDDRTLVDKAWARYAAVGEFSVDHRLVLTNGTIRWVQLSGKQECDESGEPVRRLAILIDITARKEAEVSLERLARFDPLTGLPNRSTMHDALSAALDRHEAMQQCCAVLFLDLDRFKDINDTLGHSVGDLLLKEVASRIRSLLPAGTLVARWGGDEFVAVLHEVDGEEAVERTCQRVVQGLTTPFAVDSYEFAVMASIGAAIYPRDGTDPEVLIRSADTAMYAAKEVPGRRYAFFATQMHTVAAMRHHIQNELQSAVHTSSLALYYQPIVDRENNVVSAEALLRWTDADGHVHPPADFISIAEDTGAIIPIGMWVVEQAARQAMQWNRSGIPLSVSVNISPRQLEHPDFAESLSRVLRESGVEPSLLEIEITESVLVPNAPSVMRVLENVRRMGVRIAVDDFGTGYSAFSYLKQLPLHTLKIDRTFVDGIERDVDRAIAESIISIAHKLGLSVTAEGVETVFQRKILSELSCDRLQGFQICRPVPIERFEEFARLRLAAS